MLLVAGAALALAVGGTVLWDGGFDSASRSAFAVLAGVALLAAAALDGGVVARTACRPLTLVLAALAVLALGSAAWTVGAPAEALRSGMTIGACAAVLVAAGTVARAAGVRSLAIGIAALAAVEAIVGIDAVVRHALPYAEAIDGSWRPGGTFEYPPALALLQVGALPVLSAGVARFPRPEGAIAGLAAVLAGAVLGLSGSRLAPALTAVVLLALCVRVRAARATVVLLLLGAVAAPALVDVHSVAGTHPSGVGPARSSDVLHGRAAEWRAALATWDDRPLLGAGAGAYGVASAPHRGPGSSPFAHDLPLELAAELGVFGLVCAVALYASAASIAFRGLRDPSGWLLAPMVGALLISGLVDWTWHLAGLAAVWAAAAGGLLGLHDTVRLR